MTRAKKPRILIIKIGAIGDVIMALPLLEEIKKKMPAASIHWLVGKKSASFLSKIQGIDKVHIIEDAKLLSGSFFSKIAEVFKAWRQLGLKRYDGIYILHKDPRYRYLTLTTFGKKSGLFKERSLILGRYHADEYVRAFHGLDNNTSYCLNFPSLSSSKSKMLSRALESLGQRFVVLAPGGDPKLEPGKELRMWPVAYYVELSRKLITAGFQVALIGSSQDKWVLDFFDEDPKIKAFMGTLELTDIPLLMARASCSVTHDSGPMHMAIFAKAPLVAIFGPTIPDEKLPLKHPHFASKIKLHWAGEHLTCRPCYDGVRYASCASPLCMKATSVPAVYQSICELIHEENRARA